MTTLPSEPTPRKRSKRKRSPGAKDPDPFIAAVRQIEAGSEALMALILATPTRDYMPRAGLAAIPTPALLHGYKRLADLARITSPRVFPDLQIELLRRGLCPCGAGIIPSIVRGGWDRCGRCGDEIPACECPLAPFVPGVTDG